MTFALDATPEPLHIPPRVALTATEDDADLSIQSVSLFRDGVPLRFEAVVTGDEAIAYDYDAPFDVALLYRADGVEVGSPIDWTEDWASAADWTGSGWSVGGGTVSSTAPASVIYRDASSGSIIQLVVTSPSNLTFQLTDSADLVLVSVLVSPDGTVTLSGSTASKVTGSGSFTLSLSEDTASIAGTGWSTSVGYTGVPTRVRLVAPAVATYVSKFGSNGPANGQMAYPQGIAIDGSGNIWIADTSNNRVQKFNSSGVYQSQFGTLGTGNGQFHSPTGVVVDGSGNIWVVDSGNNNRVQKFNSSGVYQSQFGTFGTGNGQFNSPTGIALDGSGNIFVADTSNNRIQKFDSSGVYQSQFGTFGSGDGQFNQPRGIAIDGSGNIFVADTINRRIQKFDSSGAYQAQFGSSGSGDGQFNNPYALTIDGSGNIWVVDTYNNRVQEFTTAVGSTDDVSIRIATDAVDVTASDTATVTGVEGAWLTNAAIPDQAILIDAFADTDADYFMVRSTAEETELATNTVALEIEGSADVLTVATGPRKKQTWTLDVAATTVSARRLLLEALANDAPISLRFPATGYDELDTGFYAVGDLSTTRIGHPAHDHVTVVSMPLRPSRAPKFKPLWQWNMDALAQTGMSMDDVNAAYTSMNDLLIGPG